MARIRNVLDLAIAHLPADMRDDLAGWDGVTAYRYSEGWLMWVPDDVDDSAVFDPPPDVVLAVQRYARSLGCDWVMFDRDGDLDDTLAAYGQDESQSPAGQPAPERDQ